MEKKEYIKPIIEVIYINDEDIVTASNEFDPNDDLDDPADPWFS